MIKKNEKNISLYQSPVLICLNYFHYLLLYCHFPFFRFHANVLCFTQYKQLICHIYLVILQSTGCKHGGSHFCNSRSEGLCDPKIHRQQNIKLLQIYTTFVHINNDDYKYMLIKGSVLPCTESQDLQSI